MKSHVETNQEQTGPGTGESQSGVGHCSRRVNVRVEKKTQMDRWRLDRWRKDRTIRLSLAVPSEMAAGSGESAALDLAGQSHEGGWSSTVKEVAGHELEENVPMKLQGPGPSSNISQEECAQTQKRSQNKEMAPRVSLTGRSVRCEACCGVPTDHEARRQERSS